MVLRVTVTTTGPQNLQDQRYFQSPAKWALCAGFGVNVYGFGVVVTYTFKHRFKSLVINYCQGSSHSLPVLALVFAEHKLQ